MWLIHLAFLLVKGLLLILGLILVLILLLIATILFVPIVYKSKGDFKGQTSLWVKVHWLFGLLRVQWRLVDQTQNLSLKFAFFQIYPRPQKDKAKKKPNRAKKMEKEIAEEEKQENIPKTIQKHESDKSFASGDSQVSSQALDNKKETIKQNLDSQQEEQAEKKKRHSRDRLSEAEKYRENSTKKKTDEGQNRKNKEKKNKYKKIKKSKMKQKETKETKETKKSKKSSQIFDQVNEIWKFLKKSENKGLFGHIKKYVFKMIKWFWPKQYEVDMEIGFEDPSLTGYMAGATAIAWQLTKQRIHVTPNFNKSVIQGSYYVGSHLFLVSLVYYLLRLILDRRVIRTIKKVRE